MPFFRLGTIARRYALHVELLRSCAPGLSALCLGLSLVVAAATTISLIATGLLVAALSVSDSQALTWTAATAATFLIILVTTSMLGYVSRAVSARYLILVCDRIVEAGATPYTLATLEDPQISGELRTLAEAPRDWLFQVGVDATWTLLTIRLTAIGAFAVLASWSWWPPIMLAIGWMLYSRAFTRWSSTIFDGLLDLTGTDRRRAGYLHGLLTEPSAAKEVRLFGLTDLLVGRFTTSWHKAQRLVWANRTSSVRRTMLILLAPLTATGVALSALLVDVQRGAVGTGILVTLVQAICSMAAFGPHTDPQVALARTLATVSALHRVRTKIGFGDSLPVVPEPSPHTQRRPGRRTEALRPATVEICNVSFSYPSASRPTIGALNLTIPAGQSLALVGLNGAGKSTLIKLLCGLQRPDRGSIRIDGQDPQVDPAARRRLAVIFQDFVRYHLTLHDNIALREPFDDLRDRTVQSALHDAGGDEILAGLRGGFDTVLSSEYDGGTDLSGGQWQRVALARALAALRREAGLLILDEPTSALDVRAEAALFDRFLTVARGATTILVSHRLSSVRQVDRIVVLADAPTGSRIIEDGTHQELIKADGQYAELFRLQSSRFTRLEDAR
ncbi:MAG TPA: ABC transporter ATP-binding protein [Microlunatus sp.]